MQWSPIPQANLRLYRADYVRLFVDTVREAHLSAAPWLNFVDTSPSSGLVSRQPYVKRCACAVLGGALPGADSRSPALPCWQGAGLRPCRSWLCCSPAQAQRLAAPEGAVRCLCSWRDPNDPTLGDVHYVSALPPPPPLQLCRCRR